MKKTKIVSTLGPASTDVDTIVKLINAGANIFRFNFSHGDHPEHLGRIENVHKAEEITGKHVGIMLDTKGAEIRTTVQKEGKIEFNIGDKVRISMDDSLEGTKEKIAVTYAGLFDDVHEGGHVLFDDGLLDMLVDEKDEANKELVCHVLNHGILGSRKGVNAPGVSINLPGITEKDTSVQKNMIRRCNELGKPVITATQMLDSMQENPRPTRAEVSDVANAVFDGTDATMLSGESANGDYPVESVATMNRIDIKAENNLDKFGREVFDFDKSDVTETIGSAVATAARDLGVKAIVAATASGYTARMISKYRPSADILALTFDERTERGLMINWGVQPYVVEKPTSTDEMFELASKEAKDLGFANVGDKIIVVAGLPIGQHGTTNMMRVQEVK